MLLDRRRIRKWARWVALGLAIVFGVSFVGLRVGSGSGLNFTDLWSGDGTAAQNDSNPTPEERISAYEAQLEEDPQNPLALEGIAQAHLALDQNTQAAQYLERLAKVEDERVDVLMQLAAIYLHPDSRNYQAAVSALNRATSLDPQNAEAFLQLGVAQRGVGNTEAASMAWNRYLVLAPEGEMADTVRGELEALAPTDSTTNAGPSSDSTTNAQ